MSTHQQIRQAPPARTVFTAYHAFAGGNPADTRRRLESAGTEALRDIACADLLAVYGRDLWRHVRAIDLTGRGHAMAVPTPGFRRDDVVLLSFRGREHSALLAFDQIGPHTLRRFSGSHDLLGQPVYSAGEVLAESVHRFKGQSAPAAALARVSTPP
ncbi:MAG: hypothetical protein HY778_00320 [Betaproteobacteria bacterium]|nr:hypothetical protein [Betaproteobacteria bacterium]